MSEKALVLKTVKNPFNRSDSEIRYYPLLKTHPTLEETLQDIFPLYPEFIISVNGRVIEGRDYGNFVIKEGDWILAYPTIHGGGQGGGKDMMRMVAMIAIMVASMYAPEMMFGAQSIWLTEGQMLACVIGFQVVGGLLVNILLPASVPETKTPETSRSSTHSWSPKTTQQQGLVVPRFYGKNKLVGNVISAYTESIGNEQAINFLVSLGMGPYYRLYDFKINDQFIADISGVEIHTRLGLLAQTAIPNFNDTKTETTYSHLVTYYTPHIQSTTSNDFNDLEIEISFPSGLYQLIPSTGNMESISVRVQVDIRKMGDTDWIPISLSSTTLRTKVFNGRWSAGVWALSTDGGWFPSTSYYWTEYANGGTNPYTHYEGEAYSEPGEGWFQNGRAGIWRWISSVTEVVFDTETVYKEFAGNSSSSITYVFKPPPGLIDSDKGQYEVRIQRITEDRSSPDQENPIVDKVYLKSIREIYFDDFIYPREVLAGVKGITSETLSGSLDFSCMAECLLVRYYDGTDWHIGYNNNPAWVAYDILSQPVFNDAQTAVLRYDGLDPSKLNTASFKVWADFCDELVNSANSQSQVLGTDGRSYKCILSHVSSVRDQPIQGGIDNLCQVMVGNATPSGYTCTASNTLGGDASYSPYKAFDGQTGTAWVSDIAIGGVWWLAYEFSEAKHVQKYAITPYEHPAYRPISWIFQGWNGASWVDLDTQTDYMWPYNGKQEFTFSTATSYTKYRLYITRVDPGPYYSWHNYDPSDPSSNVNLYIQWPSSVGASVAIAELELIDTDTSWATYWEVGGDATNGWLAGNNYYKGQEKRITFNGGFDVESSAWEAALKVAYVGRATLWKDGSVVKVAVDKEGDPEQLFSVGDIYVDSFKETFIPFEDRASELEIDFVDAENDYQRDKLSWYNSNIQNVTKKATIDAFGLTSPSEVQRFARYILAGNQYLIRRVEFDVDIEALACELGDVFYLQHDVPEWGEGGRLVSATSNSVTLDHEVTMVAGTTYKILVKLSVDDSIVEKTITPSPGTHRTIYIVGTFSTTPSQYDVYAFGTSTLVAKKFKMAGFKKTMDNKITVTGIEYAPEIYTTDDQVLTLPVITSPIVDKTVTITDLELSEKSYLDETGNIKRIIVVGFSVGTATIYQFAEIRYYDGYVWRIAGTTRGFRFEIPDVAPNTTYTVMVIGVNAVGARVSTNNAPTKDITTSSEHKAGYSTLVGRVSGLKIFESEDPETFSGRDCKFIWNRLSGVDTTDIGAGEETAGAASFIPNIWLLDYKVVISVGSTTRRTEYVSSEKYDYTFEKNSEDGSGVVVNSFTISVTARDKYFRESTVSSSMTVSNSAPSNVGTITVKAYEDGASFTWDPVSDSDIRGYKVRTQVESGGWSSWEEISKNEFYRDLTGTEMINQGWGSSNIQIEVLTIDYYDNISTTPSTANIDCNNKKSYLTVSPTAGIGVFTTITAALAALPAEGGSIFVKNGTYTGESASLDPSKFIHIFGESEDGVILVDPYFYSGGAAKPITFEYLTFTSTSIFPIYKSAGFVYWRDSGADGDLSFRKCSFNLNGNLSSRIGDIGIYLNDFSSTSLGYLRLEDCTFTGLGYCIFNFDSPVDFTCTGNKFYGVLGSVSFAQGGNVVVSDNILSDVYGGISVGSTSAKRTIISNNQVIFADDFSYTGSGIYYSGNEGVIQGNIVKMNNTVPVTDTVPIGISILGNTDKSVCAGNVINMVLNDDKAAASYTAVGIYLAYSTGFLVSGNSVTIDNNYSGRDTLSCGIMLNATGALPCSDNIVSNNSIDMINSSDYDIGIYIDADASNNRGSSNKIINAGKYIRDDGTGNTINKYFGGTF